MRRVSGTGWGHLADRATDLKDIQNTDPVRIAFVHTRLTEMKGEVRTIVVKPWAICSGMLSGARASGETE
jgi:hypothetical protein